MGFINRMLLRACTLGTAALLCAGGSFAATFDVTDYQVTLHTSSSNGTALLEQDAATLPINFSLTNVNDQYTVSNLFNILVNESCCSDSGNDNDQTANPISVSFTFDQPTGGTGSPVTGETQGHIVHNAPDNVTVNWDGPITFSFDTGVQLQIALSNLTITCLGGEDHGCTPDSVFVKDNPNCRHDCSGHWETDYSEGSVDATFTLLDAGNLLDSGNSNPTPLPASLPMFVSGVGGAFSLLRWRKKRNAGVATTE